MIRVMKMMMAATIGLAMMPQAAGAQVLGSDAAACTSGGGPAILARIEGLKDRKGNLKLELYPANEEDFLQDDSVLVSAGKTFRRVQVPTPAGGAIALCIRVPRPGRYALLFTHDRDGKNKFNFWSDGAGFPANTKLGRRKPPLASALIDVPNGVATTTIRAQYLRGLGGFGPVE
ncbi:DUF2141 domain-containing protein [Sphingomonas sp. gentR]|jgi:uncharacterized protein (DUF2141 family)|uniref:Uncharacterized protein (DUF2141 family) n=2 Tax=Sphingomonas yabuuchiae TaxID=172044 RepID=A0ABR6K9Q2_9SPHN|nr:MULTISPECIES: DUF2141 domain-containing protein [Sphingomonas]APX64958.1 hypothetical protein AV944_02865 [Sphingomonas sp. LK11]KQO50197.1 hypothetical protein ASF14_12330 [Sphingomonas sp. Leaf257]MBB4609843.1 uncharacterized protein (DUF2141 family) [Sphingomonas yabuuchiae]